MASIQKYYLKDGKTPRWAAHFRDGRGRQIKKVFKREKDARAHLVEVQKEVADGTFTKTRATPMEDVLTAWVEDLETRVKLGEIRASTAATMQCNVRVHIAPFLNAYRSDRVTPAVMAQWRSELAAKVAAGDMAPKSFNNIFTLARSIFTWAAHPARAYIVGDPLVGQRRLTLRKKEAAYLEEADVGALLAAAADDAEASALVHVMLFGGLRRGEAFALQWGDVVTEDHGGRLRVRRSLYAGEVTPTKTTNSERAVDVPAVVLDALRRHRAVTPPAGEDGFIFRTSTGQPIDPNSWYGRTFEPLRERAGLRSSIGLHSLRHTFASLLIRNGENPKYVSAQLGHSSTSFTMDTYGHLFESTSREAMDRMQKLARSMERQQLRVVEGGRK